MTIRMIGLSAAVHEPASGRSRHLRMLCLLLVLENSGPRRPALWNSSGAKDPDRMSQFDEWVYRTVGNHHSRAERTRT
jgi:hypothetical protein